MSRIIYLPSGGIEIPDDPAIAGLQEQLAALQLQVSQQVLLQEQLARLEEQVNQLAFTQVESAVATTAMISEVAQELNDQVEALADQIDEQESEGTNAPDIESESEGNPEPGILPEAEGSGENTPEAEPEGDQPDAVLIRIERPEPERESAKHTRFRRGR